jgi:hypothetical protein
MIYLQWVAALGKEAGEGFAGVLALELSEFMQRYNRINNIFLDSSVLCLVGEVLPLVK